tara:strand:- start:6084 stop:6578 length:495 start_codon:yes stop_codon:yes gene_type:complete
MLFQNNLIKTKIYILAYLIFICLAISGCSNQYEIKSENQKKGLIKSVPDWYVDSKQEDSKWLYEVATSISPDIELGKRKTTLLAKAKLGDRINGILQEQTILKLTEIGNDNQLTIKSDSKTEIINSIKEVMLENYLIDKYEILGTDNDSYRTYIRIKVLKVNVL